eukprot:211596-Amphidinium_carterae.1
MSPNVCMAACSSALGSITGHHSEADNHKRGNQQRAIPKYTNKPTRPPFAPPEWRRFRTYA